MQADLPPHSFYMRKMWRHSYQGLLFQLFLLTACFSTHTTLVHNVRASTQPPSLSPHALYIHLSKVSIHNPPWFHLRDQLGVGLPTSGVQLFLAWGNGSGSPLAFEQARYLDPLVTFLLQGIRNLRFSAVCEKSHAVTLLAHRWP